MRTIANNLVRISRMEIIRKSIAKYLYYSITKRLFKLCQIQGKRKGEGEWVKVSEHKGKGHIFIISQNTVISQN